MTVFVADDSTVIRQHLARLIQVLDGRLELVGEAGAADEAVRGIRQTRPGAVVLDIRMPGGSGLAVLETVKREWPETICVMFTNYAHALYRRRCAELGAEYFLDKATDFDELRRVLREWAQR